MAYQPSLSRLGELSKGKKEKRKENIVDRRTPSSKVQEVYGIFRDLLATRGNQRRADVAGR